MGEPGGDGEGSLAALPWPNLRGKRCLVRSSSPIDLAGEVRARGAATVDTEASGARYDVVVACAVLDDAPDAGRIAAELREQTRAVLLSIEPIDLRSSLVARGRPLFTPTSPGRFGFNGAGHRYLLESAGFSIERVSKPLSLPFVADDRGESGLDALVLRALTKTRGPGRLHRALLGRPVDA